ncbi:MAG: thermonuclease family protein [Planctomycetia bacterium]|nr:thermonuclease family protein [Planctomycetia bacterium]
MARPAYSRRRRIRPRDAILLLVVVALVVGARRWYGDAEPSRPESLAEDAYQVQRVVDGDTLLLANEARIRLIGADTPETVKPNWPVEPWGPEATEFTKQFVAGGEVWLRFDRERQDRYGRFLAYVWVGDRMLNEELIRAGLAKAEMGFRYSSSMKTRFRRAEQEARAAQRGIWSAAEAN